MPVSVAQLPVRLDEGSFQCDLGWRAVSSRPVELTVGMHRIECKPDCQTSRVWVGLSASNWRLTKATIGCYFVNWY